MAVAAVLTAMWDFIRAVETDTEPLALVKAEAVMRERIASELTLEEIAKAAGVSVGHLIELAKRHWNMTPMRRLWELRVEHASGLLRDTGLTISEVAHLTGFANPFHFSRRFKRRYGEHPRSWRGNAWRDKV